MSSGISSPPKLPKGWVCTVLGEVIEPSDEKIDPAKAQNMPYIGLEHIGKDSGKLVGCGYANDVRSTKTRFYVGDLLYGRLRPYLNKAHVIDCDGICSTDILVFPAGPYLSNKFLLYRILFGDFVSFASHNMSGVQHPRVSFRTLSRFPVFLPPLPEQRRIVAKIEELFTSLDAGVESLKKIEVQLKHYRQSVLKHAFEGKLTAEWRQVHKDELEPASLLLKRIKQERQKTAKGKHKELPPPDTSDLPRLPESWAWTRIGEIYDVVGGGTPSTSIAEYWEGDIPWITSADILGLRDIRPRKQITAQAIENSATNLVPAGSLIVVTRVGLGKIALTNMPICFSQDSQALVACNTSLLPDYSLYCLSEAVQVFKWRHRGTTINGVPKKQLAQLLFAVPPLPEQRRIVEEIERRFSVADEIERTIDQSLRQSGRLRQSILRRAFEGKLLSQDPKDEPAQTLLERIKAERTRQLAEAKAPGKNSKRARTNLRRPM